MCDRLPEHIPGKCPTQDDYGLEKLEEFLARPEMQAALASVAIELSRKMREKSDPMHIPSHWEAL